MQKVIAQGEAKCNLLHYECYQSPIPQQSSHLLIWGSPIAGMGGARAGNSTSMSSSLASLISSMNSSIVVSLEEPAILLFIYKLCMSIASCVKLTWPWMILTNQFGITLSTVLLRTSVCSSICDRQATCNNTTVLYAYLYTATVLAIKIIVLIT